MFPKILAALAVVLLILVIFISMRPGEFSISRSILINAPASAVFPQINNLRNGDAWSPWGKMDPQMKKYFEGPASGVGSTHSWAGNQQVGEGRMTIVESRPDELVRTKLEFLKPFKATNEALFTLKPEGGGTRVTWTMSGKNNFLAKAMSLFMNCEKMVGPEFEKGLASMKAIVEMK